jgi:hypothetical protein
VEVGRGGDVQRITLGLIQVGVLGQLVRDLAGNLYPQYRCLGRKASGDLIDLVGQQVGQGGAAVLGDSDFWPPRCERGVPSGLP